MSWSEAVRSVEPRDHIFSVSSKEVLFREILPPFVRRAIGLRGVVALVFASRDLEVVKASLAEAIPELDQWMDSELVRFINGDPLMQNWRNPTPMSMRIGRRVIVEGYREALVRGRTLWYAGGVGGQLLEQGLINHGQTLFGEMFLQNLHWDIPFTMLCPYFGTLDPDLQEGLHETHDGALGDPR